MVMDLGVTQESGIRQGQQECFVHYFVQFKELAKCTPRFFTVCTHT